MTVQAAYDLVSIIRWIDERTKTPDVPGDARKQIAAACFDNALEHQAAIALLAESQLHGSAHALLRVMADAFIRGMWIARCATDDEVARFREDKVKKGIKTLVQEIEAALHNTTDTLSCMVNSDWSMLCSFTHTGYSQVTHRFTGAILRPAYSDLEIIQTLNFAGAMGLLAAAEFATISGDALLLAAILERADKYADQKHGQQHKP